MNPLLQQFLSEGRDFIEQIGQKLLILEETPNNEAVVGELFRFVHTLKGNSGLFDLPILTRVVHAAEDLLDRVRDHELTVTSELTDDLLSAMDFVVQLLDEIEDGGTIPDTYLPDATKLVDRLRSLLPERDVHEDEEGAEETMPAPTDWSWLSRLTEEQRVQALAQTPADQAIWALFYLPEPQCFFKGEDPLLLLKHVPGLAGFSIRAAQPWSPLDELDIYTANLAIDALSMADRAELDEHLRYVPEQIAVYQLPRFALAVPTGDASEVPGVYADFFDRARDCLGRSDMDGLRVAVDAMLDMINPTLWMASALRWCLCLQDMGFDTSVLAFHLEATADHKIPDWFLFNRTQSASLNAPDKQAAPIAVEDPKLPAGTLSDMELALWDRIFETQRQFLAIPSASAQWGGRLASVYNTLTGLLRAKGDVQALAALEDAAETSEQEKSFAPLLEFLDGYGPIAVCNDEPLAIVAEETVVPMVVELAAERQIRQDRRAGEGAIESTRRAAEVSADKAVRTLKVPQEKVDRLMDLIGEMVVAKNALPYLAARAEDVFGSRELGREIKSQYAIINRIAEEMQDGIMQVRMLPVDAIFQRFPRLVRDVAKQLGKKVRLVIEGEDTEADKNIIESLGDPMIHILRNSLDHGIEMPEVRAADGKAEEGRLSVRASQEGDRVLIEIEDDGKGIDPAVIKRKAFEKGLIDEQRLDTISDADAVQLVFAAGFSTAETVSNLSGRGVGMDVVRSSLEKVGGQVRLTSEKGKGTKIILSLPLSMSVSNVMMVDIGGQNFGVPIDVVVETVRIKQSDIHIFKQRRTAVLRGRIVPLYSTDELLASHNPPKPNADGEYAVLVARVHGETVGIVVDGFAQTIDVILKPLEGALAGLAGFAGSALLGDGSVLLVLNIKELI
ncbi:chemotaxis protein CheA [Neorhizobium lilium]|uniref:Chemotaxis protein CheA n=1 Tax=Neorhizobium lilium TaxID=2503024 RepID=A0A444LKZ4_9HYPH|nr:chemotaxis protein CheA [Neorhizobium lilium]RWX81005.1 chemotaxis protein CheA [Neorhizobium lilium]